MGFVSYHEDILKRHESDIHDLIRDLEDGHLALTQQKRVLPEFQWILEQLRSLLSDPSHPVAVRLLEVRSRTSALEVELKSMTDKRNVLAQKNCELADRERHLQSSVVRLKDELRNTRRESEALGGVDKLVGLVFTGHGRTEPQGAHRMCRAIWREA